jgi:L-ascorbate metabolism protein UlaG (beta-lactamase superfamily)
MRTYLVIIALLFGVPLLAQYDSFEYDIVKTSHGDLKMSFIGHGTLLFEINNKVIHIDPVSRYADYSNMPDADLILITHHHGDHLDQSALKEIAKENTVSYCTSKCKEKLDEAIVLNNGDKAEFEGILIEAVPAYNLVHKRKDGNPYHPKGIGNGYILTFGDTRVYIGGDTENIPEMKEFKNVNIAFLPMNTPYTMTPAMAKDAAEMISPEILYPYHYGNTDVNQLIALLKGKCDCEIRIRKLQ